MNQKEPVGARARLSADQGSNPVISFLDGMHDQPARKPAGYFLEGL